ncbi:MAG: hypothetical protein IPI35_04270 [Deltaproteobacteria bacterium]|nr:hypothetical protein [Deltaproteobacteria bacterium]
MRKSAMPVVSVPVIVPNSTRACSKGSSGKARFATHTQNHNEAKPPTVVMTSTRPQ